MIQKNIGKASCIFDSREYMRFDIADGLYGIIGDNQEESQCVFIGNNIKEDILLARLNTTLKLEGYNNLLYYQPMSKEKVSEI